MLLYYTYFFVFSGQRQSGQRLQVNRMLCGWCSFHCLCFFITLFSRFASPSIKATSIVNLFIWPESLKWMIGVCVCVCLCVCWGDCWGVCLLRFLVDYSVACFSDLHKMMVLLFLGNYLLTFFFRWVGFV